MAPKDKILKEAQEKSNAAAAQPSIPVSAKVIAVLQAVAILSVAGAASEISQLTLAPVYGSIPSSLYHANLVTFVIIIAYISRRTLEKYPYRDYQYWIAPLMYWTLPIQFGLLQRSEMLGPVWGPMVTEAATFLPVLLLALLASGFALDRLELFKLDPRLGRSGPALASFAIFTGAEKGAQYVIPRIIGTTDFFTRTGLQMIAATFAAMSARSRLLVFAVPAMVHTLFNNPHHYALATTKYVNSTLYEYQYGLVDRKDSLTGYISVIHNKKDQWYAMRCDHSMLGGEWLVTPKRKRDGQDQRETLYSVFNLLEGVRLIKNEVFAPDDEKDALFIGLGVGTAPKAFIAHGINTTIVEIDPVVHEFATKYFELPPNHNKVIADAVTWAAETAKTQPESFDYIVHDVFTGGAEPVQLFTHEFISDLSLLLKEDGGVAINYAGDMNSPATRYVLNTIFAVFPTCRIYRDTIPTPGSETFLNMVVFCVKTSTPIVWRLTTNQDYLGTMSRRAWLPPDDGYELKLESIGGKTRHVEGKDVKWSTRDIVAISNTSLVEEFRKQGAIRHWEIMRTVVPDKIWETW